jgi:hypothetical protein
MKISDIELFQCNIQNIRDNFLFKSLEFSGQDQDTQKQKAYSKNRDIISQKIQETLMC